jgi:hypothetical protein
MYSSFFYLIGPCYIIAYNQNIMFLFVEILLLAKSIQYKIDSTILSLILFKKFNISANSQKKLFKKRI